jgi:hypothetical protein
MTSASTFRSALFGLIACACAPQPDVHVTLERPLHSVANFEVRIHDKFFGDAFDATEGDEVRKTFGVFVNDDASSVDVELLVQGSHEPLYCVGAERGAYVTVLIDPEILLSDCDPDDACGECVP